MIKKVCLLFMLFISFLGLNNNLYAEENLVKIGSHFVLTDQEGNNFDTSKNITKKYFLVFFGYTTCPEICPTALNNIKLAMEKEKINNNFQPLFITLNPEKDDLTALKNHYDLFDNKIIMLRGDAATIKNLANEYKIYYGKNEKTGEIDHSSIIYIMNQKGEYVDHVMGNDLEVLKKKLLSIK